MGETGEPEQDERAIFEQAMDRARACLREHRVTLERLACALLARETLRENELSEILNQT